MESRQHIQLRIIAGLAVLGALFLEVRLYYVQVVHGESYAAKAEGQYVDPTLLFDRGNIFFTEKDGSLVSAATIASGVDVAVIPDLVEDSERLIAEVGALLPIDVNDVQGRLKKKGDPYELIAEHVPATVGKQIVDADIDGLHIADAQWRIYPGGSLAAQVIGFIGYDAVGTRRSGRYGVERQYEEVLARGEGEQHVNFFAELFADLSTVVFDRGDTVEGDLILSIEPTVQASLERELASVMEEHRSALSGGIVMDPRTGAIIAMAGTPGFDLNAYGSVDDLTRFKNPNVENLYEMGSTVKPLTMAAGLDAGVITPKSTYDDPGVMTLDRRTFGNFDGRARGPGTTMQQILSESLNTGVAHIVGRLGNEQFAEYFLDRFRIGEETGIDLPGEAQGLVTNLSSTRDIEYATASFGQGIAITPINMACALSALANGGIVPTPTVAREVRYRDGRVRAITPPPGVRAIGPEASEEVTRMLVEVTDSALLGGSVKIPEYAIAAKTGTAQLPRPRVEGGGYYDDRYVHSFFGYFPAYDPEFLVFLYTVDPKEVTFASHTLTQPFMRLAKFLIHYYDIPPDRDPLALGDAPYRVGDR